MTNFAKEQLKSLMDRVLRLKAEQDTLSADIMEIYAEAKSNGFDKTVMGLAVARIRKEQKFGAMEVAETDSLLDLYLEAYNMSKRSEASSGQTNAKRAVAPLQSPANGLPASPPHTREGNAAVYDPDTGEIIETQATAGSPGLPVAAEDEGAVNQTSSAAPIPPWDANPIEQALCAFGLSGNPPHMADEAAEGASSQSVPSAADTSDDLALPAFLNRVNWRAA